MNVSHEPSEILYLRDDMPHSLEQAEQEYLSPELPSSVTGQTPRQEMWQQNEAEVKAMLGIDELPRQKITKPEWGRYEEKIATGNETAVEELFMRRLRTIYGTAKTFHNRLGSNELTVEDCFQYAVEGFYQGIEIHDRSKRPLTRSIQLGIYSRLYFEEKHRGIINDTQHAHINKYEYLRKKATDELGPFVGSDEITSYILEKSDITLEDIEVIEQTKHAAANKALMPVGPEEEEPDPEYEDYDLTDRAIGSIKQEKVAKAAQESLRNRERNVLGSRYKPDGERSLTLEEIGADMGVSSERVRQIESGALKKLGDHPELIKLITSQLIQDVEMRRPILMSDDPRERAIANRLGFRAMHRPDLDEHVSHEEERKQSATVGASPTYTELGQLIADFG